MTPSGIPDATATTRGLMSDAAQAFAGLKSFPAGIGSGAGAAAADVLLKVGTTLAPASIHEDARLFTVRASLGGSEVEFIRVQKPATYGRGVLTVDSRNVTNTRGIVLENQGAGASGLGILNAGGGVFSAGYLNGASFGIDSTNRGLHFTQNSNAYDTSKLVKFEVLSGAGMSASIPAFDFSAPSNMVATALLLRVQQASADRFTLDQSGHGRFTGNVFIGSGAVFGDAAGTYNVASGFKHDTSGGELGIFNTNNAARLSLNLGTGAASCTGSFTANGALKSGTEFECTATGAGVVLKSPDGTRYRLTITNAGAVQVAAA